MERVLLRNSSIVYKCPPTTGGQGWYSDDGFCKFTL